MILCARSKPFLEFSLVRTDGAGAPAFFASHKVERRFAGALAIQLLVDVKAIAPEAA